jgi:hypothetical protein
MPTVIGPRFWIRGSAIEPPGLRSAPTPLRKAFWTFVSGLVVLAKDLELRQGLDRDGNPMAALSKYTKKHRKSAMGTADPNAPPLTPAYGLSRTRSLFSAQPMSTAQGVVCWWTYDANTGLSWGEILKYHRDGNARLPVRNVFGLSNVSLARIKEQARIWWLGYQQGEPTTPGPIKFQSTGWGRATPVGGSGPSPFETRGGKIQVTIGNHVYTMQGGLGVKLPKQPPPTFASAVPKPMKPYSRQIASMKPKPAPRADLARKPAAARVVFPDKDRDELLEIASNILDKKATPRMLANLVGAPAGSKVELTIQNESRIHIRVKSPSYRSFRELRRNYDETLVIEHVDSKVPPTERGGGISRRVFARQLETAKELKIHSLTGLAARNDDPDPEKQQFGFKVWPKFGFDGPIPYNLIEKLPDQLKGAKLVSDLYNSEAGIAWWEQNGDSVRLVFDMTEDSLSWRIWKAYQASKEGPKP